MTLQPSMVRATAALVLAQEYGFAVFPLHHVKSGGHCSCGAAHGDNPTNIGKHPRTEHGYKDATTHPEQIGDWWDRWPGANIGLYPGGAQLCVVDVDGPEGELLARDVGALEPETLECITARGRHRYFRLPAGIAIGNLPRAKLDIRAHAGYVLAPPSVHPSGL